MKNSYFVIYQSEGVNFFFVCTRPRRSDTPAEPRALRLPFFIWLLGFKSKNAIRARLGGPQAKTHFWKWPEATGRNSVAELFMNDSGKRLGGNTTVILVALQPLIHCFQLGAQKGPFGGQGQSENANLGSTQKKCHVRREKGPRWPLGAHVTAQHICLEPNQKNQILFGPQDPFSVPQLTFMFRWRPPPRPFWPKMPLLGVPED